MIQMVCLEVSLYATATALGVVPLASLNTLNVDCSLLKYLPHFAWLKNTLQWYLKRTTSLG